MDGSVAVTGAGGFIGAAVCGRLASDGHDVVGLDVDPGSSARVEATGARFTRCDVTDPAEAREALSGCRLAVHTAAILGEGGRMEDFRRVNVGGTANVLDAAARVGVERVVHVSSVAVWGYEFEDDLDDEDTPPRPCGNPYIDTKGESETVALEAGATVVRPGDVYGPGSIQWAVRPLELMKTKRFRVPGRGEGLVTPVYVDDLVDCLVRALTLAAGAGRAFTAWDGHAVTAADFFAHYARMLGRDSVPRAPRPLLYAVAGAEELAARAARRPPRVSRGALTFLSRKAAYPNTRARDLLGWEPRVDLEEGMRRTESWFREQGML